MTRTKGRIRKMCSLENGLLNFIVFDYNKLKTPQTAVLYLNNLKELKIGIKSVIKLYVAAPEGLSMWEKTKAKPRTFKSPHINRF